MEACNARGGMVTKQQSVNIYIHICCVFTCLKLPGSRRGWNVFSIDSLRGSGRGPCLGPVFITSLSKRNQRVRGKKEEPFHEDTLMMKWCKDVFANEGRRNGVRMCVPTKAEEMV